MQSLRLDSWADLFLNGVHAGKVRIRSHHTSWGFGEFEPTHQFSHFAPMFASWSLMMHADGEGKRLNPEAADELRQIEAMIDHVHAQMRVSEDQWVELMQVNIDGTLIEWKQA